MTRNNTNAVDWIGEEQCSEPDPWEEQDHAAAFERKKKKRSEHRHHEGVHSKRTATGLASQFGNEDQPKEKHRSSGRSTRETESSRGLPSSHRNEDRRRGNSHPSKRAVKELEGLPRRNRYDGDQRIKHQSKLDGIIYETGTRAQRTNNERCTETQTQTPKKVDAPQLPRNTRQKEISSRNSRPSVHSQGSTNTKSPREKSRHDEIHDQESTPDETADKQRSRSRRKRQEVQPLYDDSDAEEPPEGNEMKPRQPMSNRGQRVAPVSMNMDLAVAQRVRRNMDLAVAQRVRRNKDPVYYAFEFDTDKHPQKLQIEKKNSMRKSLLVTLLVASVIGLVTGIVIAVVQP
eukprot:scaffold116720_cov49-Attheya_sp.AAC.1